MSYTSTQVVSRPSSITSQYMPIKDITNPDPASPFSSPFYRQHTLRPNNIIVEDGQLDDERWSRQAFALGMPFGDVQRPNAEARKVAQKMQRKQNLNEKQLVELLLPLVQSSAKSHKKLQVQTGNNFHHDAVPIGTFDQSSYTAWSMPLPVPKPDIAVGFTSKTFNSHELELQEGIISNAHGEPCDLAKVSQPTRDVFWPFFVVEVQASLYAAQNAAAGSASTCNNALALLAEAADEPTIQRQGRGISWQSRRAVQSFSLAVCGKTATLNLHNFQGGLSHCAAVIRSYKLDDESDMEALASRLASILIWAENCRLPTIVDLLENLDHMVQLESRDYLSDAFTNENLVTVSNHDAGSPRKRFSGIKSRLAEISPKWIRVQA
ncbi:uncharacterized protein Z518_00029 [Rhinocladiella mackenziei CBS 650.93]|uniref:Rhinocladiella mackenziei CBS 650.93 unplaced genomic scaffold supercont1.1, whole genome shotgun sequence n=1 Tax=Rhinocladiella mackenziei CBS 650.93 TaxID=1442369 RepID=A0A0D2IZY6_9EURO|nr:uncharacterized protein Z518_00029 [Rhinocladiella mackenziei CBS 650.93]KIX08951.1 hypothetical protein Z518_00029 [Rhinocladiella mackenziei CBS 650.93]